MESPKKGFRACLHGLTVLLAVVTLAAGAGAQTPGPSAPPAAQVDHKDLTTFHWQLACQAGTFPRMTCYGMIDLLHALNIHHIELSPGQALSPNRPGVTVGPDMTPADRADLLAKLKSVHMSAVSYGVVRISGCDAASEDAARQAFALGQALHLQNIVVDPADDALPMLDRLASEIAYRMYGPSLQATGEVSSGVDVWSKRTSRLILNEWYARADEAAKYGGEGVHTDHGTGLDCYKVEPSRGCGGTAVWNNGKFDVSKNYTSYQILANGPIRATFELTYAPWDAGGVQVSEVKRISLDAGSHLNRMQSTFTFSGPKTLTVAAALELHPGGTLQTPPGHRYVAVWEPGDKPAQDTHNATALLAALGTDPQYLNALGHGIYLFRATSGKPISYYAGAGWSEFGVTSPALWQSYLTDYAAKLRSPLKTHWG